MAIRIDPKDARMVWTGNGAAATCNVGRHFAMLHCGVQGVTLSAGDRVPPGRLKNLDVCTVEATVFAEATNNEFDFGAREFGCVQVTDLLFYEFLYAGRRATEGHCNLNMKAGFTANPSLDARDDGQTIDETIFDIGQVDAPRVTTPKTGFNVKVRFGDHPNNTIPLRFANTLTGANNYLALAARAQTFTVYFVTRATPTSPIDILGRFNWAVAWLVEFNWSVRTMKPTPNIKRAELLPGAFKVGAPDPLDNSASIAVNRTLPTTTRQDQATVEAIFTRRRQPFLTQSRTWPNGFRTDFFT